MATKNSIWPLVFIAVLCFWLGYKTCEFDIEMSGHAGNPFSPYVIIDQ